MAQTIYRSTDASAPVLVPGAGSLVALLDACLINGYGTKSALGWTKPFNGPDIGVYRSPEGTRFFLQVQDDAQAGIGGRLAYIRAFESMTSVSAGIDPFPTLAQSAIFGLTWPKSAISALTAKPWVLIGDGKRFIIAVFEAYTTGAWSANFFGDILSGKPGDAYHCMVIGNTNNTSTSGNALVSLATVLNSNVSSSGGFICRGDDNTTKSIGTSRMSNPGLCGHSVMGGSSAVLIPYPNPISGKLLINPVHVIHITTGGYCIRGELPGVYDVLHNQPLADQSTFTIGAETYQYFFSERSAAFALKTSAWE